MFISYCNLEKYFLAFGYVKTDLPNGIVCFTYEDRLGITLIKYPSYSSILLRLRFWLYKEELSIHHSLAWQQLKLFIKINKIKN